MKHVFLALLFTCATVGFAAAQDTCESKAIDKNGKVLAGAAKTSFLKKCKRAACEPKAVSGEGKKLVGAAKNSFMKKCATGA